MPIKSYNSFTVIMLLGVGGSKAGGLKTGNACSNQLIESEFGGKFGGILKVGTPIGAQKRPCMSVDVRYALLGKSLRSLKIKMFQ